MKSTLQNISLYFTMAICFLHTCKIKLRHLFLLILMFFKWPQEQVNYINVVHIAAVVKVFISGLLKASGPGSS